jgi:hypothetical protein
MAGLPIDVALKVAGVSRSCFPDVDGHDPHFKLRRVNVR